MSATKYRFTANQRWAIYQTHGEKCYQCGAVVTMMTMEVDHIIPERLLSDHRHLSEVITEFRLSADFDVNSYENWLPSCRSCNNKKRDIVFSCSPAIQRELQKAAEGAAKARSIEAETISDKRTAKLLTEIERAFKIRAPDVFVISLLANWSEHYVLHEDAKTVETSIGPVRMMVTPQDVDPDRLVTCTIVGGKNGRSYSCVYATPWGDLEVKIGPDGTIHPVMFQINNLTVDFGLFKKIEFSTSQASCSSGGDQNGHSSDKTNLPVPVKQNLPALVYDNPFSSKPEKSCIAPAGRKSRGV